MQTPFLIGSRIYLRPCEKQDAPTFQRYVNDPDVRRNILRDWPINLAEEEQFLAGHANSREILLCAICSREPDRLVGVMALLRFNWSARHAALGVTIGEKDCWDKGYGTEAVRLLITHAFDTLNLNRIWLEVYEFNARAIHVYEKLGFRQEGRLRQDTFRDGRYWDTLVMGVLREEWLRPG